MKNARNILLGAAVVAGIAAIAFAVAKEYHLIEKVITRKKELEADAEEAEANEETPTDAEDSEKAKTTVE